MSIDGIGIFEAFFEYWPTRIRGMSEQGPIAKFIKLLYKHCTKHSKQSPIPLVQHQSIKILAFFFEFDVLSLSFILVWFYCCLSLTTSSWNETVFACRHISLCDYRTPTSVVCIRISDMKFQSKFYHRFSNHPLFAMFRFTDSLASYSDILP